MLIYLVTVAFAALAAFLSVVLWGAIGHELNVFRGALLLCNLLLISAFSFAALRSRWAGFKGATQRGWFAVFFVALLMTAGPFFVTRSLTATSLSEHGGWWTQDARFLSSAGERVQAFGESLVETTGSTVSAEQANGAEGSGEVPEDHLAEGSGASSDVRPEGLGDPPIDGSGESAEGLWVEGSGESLDADLVRFEAESAEGSAESAEGSAESAEGSAESVLGESERGTDELAAGSAELPPDGVDVLEFAAAIEPEGTADRMPMVPPVDPVVVRRQTVWPSEDTPHPLALTLDATSLESLRDGVCALRGTERLRVAHDWIALNVDVLPDERNHAELPTPDERRERARVAFDWRAGSSEAIAALFVELSCGTRTVMVRGGDAQFHRAGGNASYWNAVELRETWLIVDVAQDAGCVPSPDCDTPYRATHFLAPTRAAIRDRIPSPGSFVPYGGDVDITALLEGPSLGPDFFAAGLALDRVVRDSAFEFAIVNESEHTIRAVVWDSGAAMSVTCRREDAGPVTTFVCPPVGVSGGRVRLLGQAADAWTWRELAAWTL